MARSGLFDGKKAVDQMLNSMDRKARKKADLFDKLTAKMCPDGKDLAIFRREIAEDLNSEEKQSEQ